MFDVQTRALFRLNSPQSTKFIDYTLVIVFTTLFFSLFVGRSCYNLLVFARAHCRLTVISAPLFKYVVRSQRLKQRSCFLSISTIFSHISAERKKTWITLVPKHHLFHPSADCCCLLNLKDKFLMLVCKKPSTKRSHVSTASQDDRLRSSIVADWS